MLAEQGCGQTADAGAFAMSHAQSPLETLQGYTPPSVTQFSIFLDNRVGKLHAVLEAFAEQPETRICALMVHEASDYAVVRLITNNATQSRAILRKTAPAFNETEVLVVELAEGHTLSRLCLHLLNVELNIHFAYPLMFRHSYKPAIALSVDDLTLAGQVLRRKGFTLLGEADLPGP